MRTSERTLMSATQLIALLIIVPAIVLIVGIAGIITFVVQSKKTRAALQQSAIDSFPIENIVAQLLRDTTKALPHYGEAVALLDLVDTIAARKQADPALIQQLLGHPETVVATMLAARAARLEALQAHALKEAQHAKDNHHGNHNVQAHLAQARDFETQAEQLKQLAGTYALSLSK